jgi:hypothetical protein
MQYLNNLNIEIFVFFEFIVQRSFMSINKKGRVHGSSEAYEEDENPFQPTRAFIYI